MQLPYAYSREDAPSFGGPIERRLALFREGALGVVKRFGRDLEPGPNEVSRGVLRRRARVGGFTVTYLCAAPGTLDRTSRTKWGTPQGTAWDPHQHVIEIEIVSRVLSLGWRGNGPIRSECYDHGP